MKKHQQCEGCIRYAAYLSVSKMKVILDQCTPTKGDAVCPCVSCIVKPICTELCQQVETYLVLKYVKFTSQSY